uniref:Arrestin domain-containing protein 2 n=1 Tax=Lygus hesperus TaxID=30085 RepID=A0A146LHA3_LYGHE
MSSSDVQISIRLDGSQEIYHSGETVKGVVVAKVNTFLRVSVLKAEFEGMYTYRNKYGGFHKQVIKNYEVKLDMDGKISDINPGRYHSPFSFTLDQSFPSSLVCLAGSVEYKITAKCGYKLSNDSSIEKTESVNYISVNRYLDLRDKPFALVGAQLKHVHPTGWCYWCCGQDLQISMEIKKRAFVAGERIEVSAAINNETSQIVSKTELDVIQTVKTKINRKVKQKVVRKERGMVMDHTEQVWINESLLVPSVPPTSDDYNMTVSYLLRMLLTLDNGKLIKLVIPIVIGNVPVDTSIIEGAGSELSFMYTGEISGGDVVQCNYIPSYIVYRFSPDALPSAPTVEEPTA